MNFCHLREFALTKPKQFKGEANENANESVIDADKQIKSVQPLDKKLEPLALIKPPKKKSLLKRIFGGKESKKNQAVPIN